MRSLALFAKNVGGIMVASNGNDSISSMSSHLPRISISMSVALLAFAGILKTSILQLSVFLIGTSRIWARGLYITSIEVC